LFTLVYTGLPPDEERGTRAVVSGGGGRSAEQQPAPQTGGGGSGGAGMCSQGWSADDQRAANGTARRLSCRVWKLGMWVAIWLPFEPLARSSGRRGQSAACARTVGLLVQVPSVEDS
jgi:hypothetical protein